MHHETALAALHTKMCNAVLQCNIVGISSLQQLQHNSKVAQTYNHINSIEKNGDKIPLCLVVSSEWQNSSQLNTFLSQPNIFLQAQRYTQGYQVNAAMLKADRLGLLSPLACLILPIEFYFAVGPVQSHCTIYVMTCRTLPAYCSNMQLTADADMDGL